MLARFVLKIKSCSINGIYYLNKISFDEICVFVVFFFKNNDVNIATKIVIDYQHINRLINLTKLHK